MILVIFDLPTLCFTFFRAEEITFESFLLLEDKTLASIGIRAGPRAQILSLVKKVCQILSLVKKVCLILSLVKMVCLILSLVKMVCAVKLNTIERKNVDLFHVQAAYCFKFKTLPSFQICSWSC